MVFRVTVVTATTVTTPLSRISDPARFAANICYGPIANRRCNTPSTNQLLTAAGEQDSLTAMGQQLMNGELMIDDIRVRVKVAHQPVGKRKPLPDGTEGAYGRVQLRGVGERSVRARSVKNGKFLIIEGSFIAFLQGHNIIGTMKLDELVFIVVQRVLRHFGITPTTAEIRAIREGRVDLERLDVVGYLKVAQLGGPGAVVRALDIGLAGSTRNRMIFPKETIVYHSHSEWWSLMAYDKAAQMMAHYPETWGALDPAVQEIAFEYLRFELRQFKPELASRGWHQVRDVYVDDVRKAFAERLAGLRADVRRPFPALPSSEPKPSRAILLGMLAARGVDLISGLDDRAQRRVWQELREKLGIDRRNASDLPSRYVQTLADLFESPSFPPRHGAPKSLRERSRVEV